jgi:SOS-response transcriptional repressor LexA
MFDFAEDASMRHVPARPRISPKPDWAIKVLVLRERLQLNQTAFGQVLQCSAMAVSRWERGVQQPPSRSYIEIGNIAGDPDCWYFWERAGFRREHVMSMLPEMRRALRRTHAHTVEFVPGKSGNGKSSQHERFVAIPLRKIVAAAHGEKGDDISYLHDAPVESTIVAPKRWCPNPSSMSCLRVQGHSMAPTIHDGYILVVDSSEIDKRKLDGKIVIAWTRKSGLTVSRFRRYDQTEVLQSDNPQYAAVMLGRKNEWKILAKVLWWIGNVP